MFREHWPFQKLLKNYKHIHILGDVFVEGRRHHFFMNCGYILAGFCGEIVKTSSGEAWKNSSKKRDAGRWKSHAGVRPQSWQRGGGRPYKYTSTPPKHIRTTPLRASGRGGGYIYIYIYVCIYIYVYVHKNTYILITITSQNTFEDDGMVGCWWGWWEATRDS